MFSSRFAGLDHEPHPLWEALSAARARGEPVLDLTRSNPTEAGLPYPVDLPALLARPESLRYAPDPKGLPAAREALAARLAARGFPGGADSLVLSASTSEAYGWLFKLLCDPGDEVLIPTPTYPLFDALAELEGVELVRYPLRHDGRWRADLRTLGNLVSTRTRALILVDPNNPTGHVADADEVRALLDLAREHGLAVIVDEVFSDYLLGGAAHVPVAARLGEGDRPLVFTLNGLSKLAGLPQLKLGWIHVAGPPEPARAALAHLEWLADAYLSVNGPVQAACADLLDRTAPVRAASRARLEAKVAAARAAPAAPPPVASALRVRPLPPEGGWSLVLEVEAPEGRRSPGDEAFALDLLRARGVHLHPGRLFGFPGSDRRFHLVASLLTPEADFREGLLRLTRHAEAWHG